MLNANSHNGCKMVQEIQFLIVDALSLHYMGLASSANKLIGKLACRLEMCPQFSTIIWKVFGMQGSGLPCAEAANQIK